MKIDHLGIAVKAVADAAKMYEQVLGLKVSSMDQVEEQGVRVAMLDIGESSLELLEATRPDSPIGKFVAKRGEGLHHIAVQVDDIEEALAQLKASGVRLIDESPRRGAHNTRVAFIHPAGTHGVLLELVEHAK
jgi:methylmalonyl-CoA/ethylmalonyl-CoA epimerase